MPADFTFVRELRDICGRIAELIDLFAEADSVLDATLHETLTREASRPQGKTPMTDQTDLFGHRPAQGSLFGPGEDRMQPPRRSTLPDPDDVRRRLHAILAKARAAERMPWSEREVRMWQTVFPNMSKWLPDEEAAQLRFEFAQEMDRLSKAA